MGRALAGRRAPGPVRGRDRGDRGGRRVQRDDRRAPPLPHADGRTGDRVAARHRPGHCGARGHGAPGQRRDGAGRGRGPGRASRVAAAAHAAGPRVPGGGERRPRHPVRPGEPGRPARQAGADFPDHPGCAPQHGQSDRPEGGIQGQRHPAGGGRGDRRAFPARVRGASSSPRSTSCSGPGDGASSSTRTSRWRPARTAISTRP